MSNIRLRFVTCRDPISEGIRLRENFWASHVEAVTPLGAGPQKYLGAHCDGGVQARDVGYDAKVLQQELFVDLPNVSFILPFTSCSFPFTRFLVLAFMASLLYIFLNVS